MMCVQLPTATVSALSVVFMSFVPVDSLEEVKTRYHERVTECLDREHVRYDRLLEQLERSATRRGDLDEALRIREERERAAGQWDTFLRTTPGNEPPDVTQFIWDWSAAEVTITFDDSGNVWASNKPAAPNWKGYRQDGDVLLWKHSDAMMWLYRWDARKQLWISRQGDGRRLTKVGPVEHADR